MAKSATRLKDIALYTGFSVNTVSLALRASPRIPEETRQQIRKVAEALNYLPNQVAQSLVRQETKSIGLILTDLTNPVLTAVAHAIQLGLAKRGYTTLFATSNNDIRLEEQMIETFRARRADGMLIFPCRHRQLNHIRRLRDRHYPVVLLVADPDAGIDAVCMDERAGAYKAVAHLLQNGHQRIILMDAAAELGNPEKLEGYLQAHADAGIATDSRLIMHINGHSLAHGYWAMDTIVGNKVEASAVFATNDSIALGVLRYCNKKGIAVPQQMSIVGMDNIEFGEYATTSLSTVNYDIESITQLAINRVLALIAANTELPEAWVTQIEPDLIVRESSSLRFTTKR